MAISEIAPCFDPYVCVLGIFAVIFPIIQLLLTNIYLSVCVLMRDISYVETSEKRRKKLPPRPKIGNACGGSYANFVFVIYVFFIFLLYSKQTNNNLIIIH